MTIWGLILRSLGCTLFSEDPLRYCMDHTGSPINVDSGAMPGKCLSIVGQDHSGSKSNQLHVDIFWFCFIHFKVYSIHSSQF